MSSAQEQIVHTIIEGFKEQRIDALDWLRHKILGALINQENATESERVHHAMTAGCLRTDLEYANAEIARLREALESAKSWLERWGTHVGICPGKDVCRCGFDQFVLCLIAIFAVVWAIRESRP